MWMKQIVAVHLVINLVAGQTPSGPSNSPATQDTSRVKRGIWKPGTCVMNGKHTFYETFDSLEYWYQVRPLPNKTVPSCAVVVAEDCVKNTFSVEVTHIDVGSYSEVEKVTIKVNGGEIELKQTGKQVKVNGATVTVPHMDLGIGVNISSLKGGDIVTVNALNGNLVVNYNFQQLIIVRLQPEYYKKVCGMCGTWNDYMADDRSITVPSGCTGLILPSCPYAVKAAARNECKKMFGGKIDKWNQHVCYKSLRVDMCVIEHCLQPNKQTFMCEHAQEMIDECWLISGQELSKPGYC